MRVLFPIPRITESFIDRVIESLGWKRYVDIRNPEAGELNADYVSKQAVLELKIFEEEGLETPERQTRIASLYRDFASVGGVVDLDLDNTPAHLRRELEVLVSRPLQTAVKKASKQIKTSSTTLGLDGVGVLFGVNNGYSSLDADNFERLLVRRCLNDSTNIDHAVCITVDYHQGEVDAFVFCAVRCHAVRGGSEWSEFGALQAAVVNAFSDGMTQMMRDQVNPALWGESLGPVRDIRFERNGVEYVREAPSVPDSRFDNNES